MYFVFLIALIINFNVLLVFFKLGVNLFLLFLLVFNFLDFKIDCNEWKYLDVIFIAFFKDLALIGMNINFWKLIVLLVCVLLLITFNIGIGIVYELLLFFMMFCLMYLYNGFFFIIVANFVIVKEIAKIVLVFSLALLGVLLRLIINLLILVCCL